jgi:hypothetical protein
MAPRTEALRGTSDQIAFLYGPVVLGGDLGAVERTTTFSYARDQGDNFEAESADAPTLIGDAATIAESLRRASGERRLAFLAVSVTADGQEDVTLRPFAELYYRHYNVYWKLTGAAR